MDIHEKTNESHNLQEVRRSPVGRFALGEVVFEHETMIITEADMRRRAGIGEDQIIVYNRETEIDVIIEEDGEIILIEGEILRLRVKPRPLVQIEVNSNPVKILHGRRTGLQIKEAAIAQGVKIALDFTLSLEGHGEPDRVIGDKDHVKIRGSECFIAVNPHENS